MTLDELIEALTEAKKVAGGQVKVMVRQHGGRHSGDYDLSGASMKFGKAGGMKDTSKTIMLESDPPA